MLLNLLLEEMPRKQKFLIKRVNGKGIDISIGQFWNLMPLEDKKPTR